MSSSSVNLSSLSGATSPLQITGLASGLDTNAIITALMTVERQPVTHLTNQQNGLKGLNSTLTSLQTNLQTVALNAQALADPGLFSTSQSVQSSNPQLISATTSAGAAIGGYQVAVTQLANSAQRTFTFASPGAADTITIDGHQTSLAAGATVQDFANAINSDANATVYAAAIDSSTVVLSNRTTGNTGTGFIAVSDPASALTEQTARARQGQDALYSIDGVGGTSGSNTVTGGIPGVTLTLAGLTTTAGPVTVTVQPPAPSSSAILSAVQTFVTSYNSVIDQVSGQLAQKPNGNPGVGSLFGDNDLTSLLGNMRSAMYTAGAGLPTGMATLLDIGIGTGAASGSSSFSADSVAGKLTVDTKALTNLIQTNPNGVKAVLQGWSRSFSQLVNNEAGPGGSIDARINGDNAEISNLSDRITTMNEMLTNRQTALQAQFAQLEATLSKYQAEGSWLNSQISSLSPSKG